LYFAITGAGPAWFTDTSMSWCGGGVWGEVGSFPHFGFVLYVNLCQVKSERFVITLSTDIVLYNVHDHLGLEGSVMPVKHWLCL